MLDYAMSIFKIKLTSISYTFKEKSLYTEIVDTYRLF